jgi:zinc transport system permease protein
MSEFLNAVATHAFLRNALIAGLLASVACGVIGTYVVTRRISLIAGSLAHSVLGGMGAAYYLRVVYDWQWLHPLHGAIGHFGDVGDRHGDRDRLHIPDTGV